MSMIPLTQVIKLASYCGYKFDYVAFGTLPGYDFFTTFDGYSAERLHFDSVADANQYFTRELHAREA